MFARRSHYVDIIIRRNVRQKSSTYQSMAEFMKKNHMLDHIKDGPKSNFFNMEYDPIESLVRKFDSLPPEKIWREVDQKLQSLASQRNFDLFWKVVNRLKYMKSTPPLPVYEKILLGLHMMSSGSQEACDIALNLLEELIEQKHAFSPQVFKYVSFIIADSSTFLNYVRFQLLISRYCSSEGFKNFQKSQHITIYIHDTYIQTLLKGNRYEQAIHYFESHIDSFKKVYGIRVMCKDMPIKMLISSAIRNYDFDTALKLLEMFGPELKYSHEAWFHMFDNIIDHDHYPLIRYFFKKLINQNSNLTLTPETYQKLLSIFSKNHDLKLVMELVNSHISEVDGKLPTGTTPFILQAYCEPELDLSSIWNIIDKFVSSNVAIDSSNLEFLYQKYFQMTEEEILEFIEVCVESLDEKTLFLFLKNYVHFMSINGSFAKILIFLAKLKTEYKLALFDSRTFDLFFHVMGERPRSSKLCSLTLFEHIKKLPENCGFKISEDNYHDIIKAQLSGNWEGVYFFLYRYILDYNKLQPKTLYLLKQIAESTHNSALEELINDLEFLQKDESTDNLSNDRELEIIFSKLDVEYKSYPTERATKDEWGFGSPYYHKTDASTSRLLESSLAQA